MGEFDVEVAALPVSNEDLAVEVLGADPLLLATTGPSAGNRAPGRATGCLASRSF
jgi:hypothetical protein